LSETGGVSGKEEVESRDCMPFCNALNIPRVVRRNAGFLRRREWRRTVPARYSRDLLPRPAQHANDTFPAAISFEPAARNEDRYFQQAFMPPHSTTLPTLTSERSSDSKARSVSAAIIFNSDYISWDVVSERHGFTATTSSPIFHGWQLTLTLTEQHAR
jgi:hypothetical protein